MTTTRSQSVDHPDVVVAPTEFSIAEYDLASGVIHLWNWRPGVVRWYQTPAEWAICDNSDRLARTVARILSHEFMHHVIREFEGDGAASNYDSVVDFDLQEMFG